MKSISSKLFILSGFIIFALAIYVVIYNVTLLMPKIHQIHLIIINANQFHKKPPPALIEIAELSVGESRISSFVAQVLLQDLFKERKRSTRWKIDYYMLTLLLKIHFTYTDRFSLWCEFSPYEKGSGINNAANYYYGRDIDKLDVKELITIVTIARAPAYFKLYPEKLNNKVDNLLSNFQKYKSQNVTENKTQ